MQTYPAHKWNWSTRDKRRQANKRLIKKDEVPGELASRIKRWINRLFDWFDSGTRLSTGHRTQCVSLCVTVTFGHFLSLFVTVTLLTHRIPMTLWGDEMRGMSLKLRQSFHARCGMISHSMHSLAFLMVPLSIPLLQLWSWQNCDELSTVHTIQRVKHEVQCFSKRSAFAHLGRLESKLRPKHSGVPDKTHKVMHKVIHKVT